MDMKKRGRALKSTFKKRTPLDAPIRARVASRPMTAAEKLDQKIKNMYMASDPLFERLEQRKASEVMAVVVAKAKKVVIPAAMSAKKAGHRSIRRLHSYAKQTSSSKKRPTPKLPALAVVKSKFWSYELTARKLATAHPKSFASAGSLLALVAVASLLWPSHTGDKSATNTDKTDVVKQSASKDITKVAGESITSLTPEYSLQLPAGKTPESLGGIQKANPEGSAPAYKYKDIVDGVGILVTEQQIPDSMKSDVAGGVKKIADSFQVSNIIVVDGITAYTGLSDKTKVQSLITTKGPLLVLIAAASSLTDDQWAAYITSLK
jgi:hypothetical protein